MPSRYWPQYCTLTSVPADYVNPSAYGYVESSAQYMISLFIDHIPVTVWLHCNNISVKNKYRSSSSLTPYIALRQTLPRLTVDKALFFLKFLILNRYTDYILFFELPSKCPLFFSFCLKKEGGKLLFTAITLPVFMGQEPVRGSIKQGDE